VALLTLGAACSDDGERRSTPTSVTPTSRPAGTGAPTDPAVLTDASTRLVVPSEPETRQIDAEAGCRSFVEQPDGTCDIVRTEGGNVLWAVEAEPGLVGADERVWKVRLWVRSETMPDGGWQVARMLPEGPGAPSYAQAGVTTADLTGDGLPELLVGYRSGGTGQFESYDVLTSRPGRPLRVAFHREGLHKGSVTVEGTDVVDYSADESAPECCPERTTRTVIGSQNGTFRIVRQEELPIDQQPPDLFT
jgi:hypothetical protein